MSYDDGSTPAQRLEEMGVSAADVAALAGQQMMLHQQAAAAIERASREVPDFAALSPRIAETILGTPGLTMMSESGRPDLALKVAIDLVRSQGPAPPSHAAWDSEAPQTEAAARAEYDRTGSPLAAKRWAEQRLGNYLARQERQNPGWR